jgi:hypothetical protein
MAWVSFSQQGFRQEDAFNRQRQQAALGSIGGALGNGLYGNDCLRLESAKTLNKDQTVRQQLQQETDSWLLGIL